MDRWVCRRCFSDNEGTEAVCTKCGLTRGAEVSVDDQRAWAAQTGGTPIPTEPPAWRRWLRFWWVPALLIFLAVGWFTSARRDDDGSLSTAGNVGVDELRPGDCFNAGDETEVSDVDGVPCTEPHAYEVYAVGDYTGEVYPASDAQFQEAFLEVCVPPFEDYVGVTYEESELWASAIMPSQDGWNDGDREFICYLHEEDRTDLTNSMRDAGR